MKQLLLLGIAAWLTAAWQACEPTTPAAALKESTFRIGPTATVAPVEVLVSRRDTITKGDTLIKTTLAVLPVIDTSAQITLIARLRALEEVVEPSEVELTLSTFAGEKMEESMAFLSPIYQDTLKLYVDYFDGDPIGSKVFYIVGEELLAVDIAKMESYWTEGGEQIKSVLTHSFYYKEKELLYCDAFYFPEKQLLLEQENAQDWVQIRQILQML